MMKIIIASNNPVKAQAVQEGFKKMFPLEQFSLENLQVPSNVSAQPIGDQETLTGARNRAEAAKQLMENADYWVGVEGGVASTDQQKVAFAWVVVLSKTQKGQARTGIFTLPTEISKLIDQGLELGDADDIVFGTQNSKQNNGAVGLLTNNVLTRSSFYEQAVVLALIPFKNPELYQSKVTNNN